MKKLLIASVMMAASHATYAVENKTTAKTDEFAKATQLYEAQNYSAAYQEMQRLAALGKAQAIHNLGYMTQIGQGKMKKKLCNIIKLPQIKASANPVLLWLKAITKVS